MRGGLLPDATLDGRFGTACRRGETGPVCFVSFVKLIARPENYDGKYIVVRGLLMSELGNNKLYASSQSYLEHLPDESIQLYGTVPEHVREEARKGVWVDVYGVFDAMHSDENIALGALHDIRRISKVLKIGLQPK
jgi:hypothetical protein